MNWYKLTPPDLVVIYDDLDLPPGKLRLRPGGGAVGTKACFPLSTAWARLPRIRVGIGRPVEAGIDSVDYVLGRMGSEAEEMEKALMLAAEAALCVVQRPGAGNEPV